MARIKRGENNIIADNRRAWHDYQIEDHFEAGLMLQGWEVKSLRAGRAQIAESHVIIRGDAAWLVGANIAPLPSASTHIVPDAKRARKLLLHQRELKQLIGSVQRRGYTIVPLNLHWQRGRAKLTIALAKGKKSYDKRQSEKERNWQREKQKLLKRRNV